MPVIIDTCMEGETAEGQKGGRCSCSEIRSSDRCSCLSFVKRFRLRVRVAVGFYAMFRVRFRVRV